MFEKKIICCLPRAGMFCLGIVNELSNFNRKLFYRLISTLSRFILWFVISGEGEGSQRLRRIGMRRRASRGVFDIRFSRHATALDS